MSVPLQVISYSLAILAASYLFPGVHVASWTALFVVVLLLIVFNHTLKPILSLLTLPLTLLTFGLFSLIINGAIVLLVDWLVVGFDIDGLGWAIVFSIWLWFVGMVLHSIEKQKR